MQNPLLRDALHPPYRPSPPVALSALQVPKRHSKCIRRGDASAANASGSLQTALSKVTRQPNFPPISGFLRRVTSDRVLTFLSRYPEKSMDWSPNQFHRQVWTVPREVPPARRSLRASRLPERGGSQNRLNGVGPEFVSVCSEECQHGGNEWALRHSPPRHDTRRLQRRARAAAVRLRSRIG
jgi:hypothetical protein